MLDKHPDFKIWNRWMIPIALCWKKLAETRFLLESVLCHLRILSFIRVYQFRGEWKRKFESPLLAHVFRSFSGGWGCVLMYFYRGLKTFLRALKPISLGIQEFLLAQKLSAVFLRTSCRGFLLGVLSSEVLACDARSGGVPLSAERQPTAHPRAPAQGLKEAGSSRGPA